MRAALTGNADRMTSEQNAALPEHVRASMIARLVAEAGTLQPVLSPRFTWRFKTAAFLAIPLVAAVLARASQWCITCVEIEGVKGTLVVAMHAVLSWPFLLGRALGLFHETPQGFPLCCFFGWTALGLVAVALWLNVARSVQRGGSGGPALPA